ncbi:hypothetical protein B0H14DRAFT_2622552 [Mycena olivaceomarginata]|nr:hypothetical protein B0H14DRAFT_2622552 [Mycena olivaceomarginata]
MPVVFRTTSITASRPRAPTRRISLLSLASSIASSSSSICSTSSENTTITPIIVTTTTFTTRVTYPATVPPPFTTSRGSDDVLPRPRRGAPPVLPPKSVEERLKAQRRLEKKSALRRAFGLRPTRARLDPALCEGWCERNICPPIAPALTGLTAEPLLQKYSKECRAVKTPWSEKNTQMKVDPPTSGLGTAWKDRKT